MTSLAERLFSIIRSPWALVLLAIAGIILLVVRLNAGRAELAQLRREKAEGELRSAGLLVLEQRRARELEDRVTGLSTELQAAIERARAAGRGVRVVEIVRASTGPVPVPAPVGPTSPGGTPPACLLAPGDTGEVEVSVATIQTQEGAQAVLGEAWAWRVTPDRARLFGGPFDTKLSAATGTPLPPSVAGRPGWGGGGWVAAGSGGIVAGPALAAPPLFGLEATLAVGFGGGDWAGALSVVWRP